MVSVSVIVPAYNASKTINRCVDSILNQMFKDFELIVINDGSTDNTSNCLTKYKDERMKIINNRNQGALISRLDGVKHASGEYVMFVDSDDWIDKIMLSTLLSYTENKTIDFIMCGLVVERKNQVIVNSIMPRRLCGNMNIKRGIVDLFLNESISGPCCKLIKKSCISNVDVNFPIKICLQEDLIMNIEILKKVNSFVSISDVFYHYVYNKDSITHKYTEKKFEMTSYAFKRIEMYFEDSLSCFDMNRIRWLYFKNFYAAIIDLNLHNNNMTITMKYKTISNYIRSAEFKRELLLVSEKSFDLSRKILIKILKFHSVLLIFICGYILFFIKYKLKLKLRGV